MTNWLHDLSVPWLVVVTFAAMLLAAAVIYAIVIAFAGGERLKAFKSVSPGLLPPMGLVFGLFVGFLAAQVWDDGTRAQLAVDREASSLRAAVLLSAEFPGRPQVEIESLIRRHIRGAVTREWPAMAHQDASLSVLAGPLAEALRLTLRLPGRDAGQIVAQREMVTSLENALDARRQRIIVSESSVNWAKWIGVIALAVLTLFAIAFVHSDNRLGGALAMALFASAAAVCIVLIAVQDRPFAGPFRVRPTVLIQVTPAPRT
jgi:hypothetical protein